MSYENEILDADFKRKTPFSESSHLLFFFTILIIFFQVYLIYSWADPGFYLPNDSMILYIFPDIFISLIDRFETRIDLILILVFISFYLFLLGISYQIVRNKVALKIKLAHILITTILVVLFFFVMIDDEMVHEALDSGLLDSRYFDNRYYWFQGLFIFWILVQIVTPVLYLRKN